MNPHCITARLWLGIGGLTCVLTSLAARPLLAAQDEDTVIVHGRVVDPVGQAVRDAKVFAACEGFDAPLSETRSGSDGTFEIAFRKSQFDVVEYSWDLATIVAAVAPGFPPAWAKWNHTDAAGEVTLTLANADTPIDGHILDLEGNPVRGAEVRVRHLEASVQDLKALNRDMSPKSGALFVERIPSLPGWVLGTAGAVKTGTNGRFRIAGLGSDRTANLGITRPGLARQGINVVTRQVEQQSQTFQNPVGVATSTTYGSSFDYTAAPGRAVGGTVRDAATNRPIQGVIVQTDYYSMNATTDERGRYRIDGLPKTRRVMLTAMPNDRQAYLMSDAAVPDAVGMGSVTVDFSLHPGVWITGKVTDGTTGKPIGGARIQYLPCLDNKFAVALPEYHRRGNALPGFIGRYHTQADGSYRVVGLPGPALVVALAKRGYRAGTGADQIKVPKAPPGWYQAFGLPSPGFYSALKEVNIPEGIKETAIDFQCDPGMTIHVSLVDPEGKPLTGVIALHHAPGTFERLKTAELDVVTLAPDEKRKLIFRHEDRKLARIVTVAPKDVPTGKITVKLEPLALLRGRFIGNDGQPVANVVLRAFPGFDGPSATTDADGRFELTILPGEELFLHGMKGPDNFVLDVDRSLIPPGTTRDLGDVHIKQPKMVQ
jgi:protocatechuate 3,4-dioxygenase beta subunit